MSEIQQYRMEYKDKLKKWDGDIARLKKRLGNGRSKAAINLKENIQSLEQKHSDVKRKLSEISDCNSTILNELKVALEQAGSDLAGSIKAAAHKFEKY